MRVLLFHFKNRKNDANKEVQSSQNVSSATEIGSFLLNT